MRQLLQQLWHDDRGAVISGELLLVATILGLGIIPGVVALRNGIVVELTELGNAIVLMTGTGSTCAGPTCTAPIPSVIDVTACP
jgi:Flp pilus assembly pilin Flp